MGTLGVGLDAFPGLNARPFGSAQGRLRSTLHVQCP